MTEKEQKDIKEFLEIVTSVIKETKGVVFDVSTLTIRNISDIEEEKRSNDLSQFLNGLFADEGEL